MENKNTKKSLNFRGLAGALATFLIAISITGIMLVFPQTHFGYSRTVKNDIDGITKFLSEDPSKENELKDIGYLNSDISFKKETPTEYTISFKSDQKTIELENGKDSKDNLVWDEIEITDIAKVNYSSTNNWDIVLSDGIDVIWNKNAKSGGIEVTEAKFHQTFLSPTWILEEGDTKNTFKQDETGDFYDYEYAGKSFTLGNTPKTENALMMFVTNATIAESFQINKNFSYKYFPWGVEKFMSPLFESKSLALMMGFSFLILLATIGGTVTMTSKFAKGKRASKVGMGALVVSIAVAIALSASLVTVIAGAIAFALMLGLVIESLVTDSDGYKQDIIDKINMSIDDLKEKIELKEDEEDKEFYKSKLDKAKTKLKALKER